MKIQGLINYKTTNEIKKTLQKSKSKLKWKTPLYLAVSVNSTGGSLVQSKNIAYLLKQYCLENKLKLYTFGDDSVMNSAHVILSSGDKVFCNPYTLLADFGYSRTVFSYHKLLNQNGVDSEIISSGKYKVRLNPFKEIQQEDTIWMNQILQKMEDSLQNQLKKQRELLDQQIFNEVIVSSQQAKDMNYIDDVITFQEFNKEEYKVIDLQKPSMLQQLGARTIRDLFYLQNNEDGFH